MLKKLIYHDYRTITGFDSCVLTKKSFDRKSNRKSTRNSKFDIWSSFYFRAKPFFFVKTQRYVLCLFALTNFWKGRAKRLPVIVPFSRETFFFFVKTQLYVLCPFALTNFWKERAKRFPVIVPFSCHKLFC